MESEHQNSVSMSNILVQSNGMQHWNMKCNVSAKSMFKLATYVLPVQNWGICYCLDHTLDSEPQIPMSRLFCCYITWRDFFFSPKVIEEKCKNNKTLKKWERMSNKLKWHYLRKRSLYAIHSFLKTILRLL